MFDFLSTLTGSANPKDALIRANFAVQDKLGKFMSLGSRVIALRDRTNDPALAIKGNSLLNGIGVIQTRAMGVLGKATDLQAKLGPNFSVKNVLEMDKSLLKESGALASQLYAINADIDAHTAKVDAYSVEVAGGPTQKQAAFATWAVPVAAVALFGLSMMRKSK